MRLYSAVVPKEVKFGKNIENIAKEVGSLKLSPMVYKNFNRVLDVSYFQSCIEVGCFFGSSFDLC